MKKYRVYGNYTITIWKEVIANDEDEARELAEDTFSGITEYCGNGGIDKLVGVESDDEGVSADGYAEFGDDIEVIEDDVEVEEEFTVDIENVEFEAPDDVPQEVLDEIPTIMYGYVITSYESDLEQDLINEIEESEDYADNGIQVTGIKYTITDRERTDF